MSSFNWRKNIEDSLKDGLIITIGAAGTFYGLKAANVKPPKASLDAMDILKLISGICILHSCSQSHCTYQGITTAAPVMNEQRGYSRQSARQRLFYTIPYNELMLPWCMESMLFHYTFRLWSWHMVHQNLHHILTICLKACMLLKYLRCIQLPSQTSLIQA